MSRLPDPIRLGEQALCWQWEGGISEENSQQVLKAYRTLQLAQSRGELPALDLVPAYCSLAVYAAEDLSLSELRKQVEACFRASEDQPPTPKTQWELPVEYRGEDLAELAAAAGLSESAWVQCHQAANYQVAFIGFQPGFPYLLGLPAELHAARRAQPRPRVPAGSLAIGGAQCGIYPRVSPGGWNLVGRIDPALLTPLQAGDQIRFIAQ